MRTRALPALLLTLGLLAAGCGGGDDGTETVDPDDTREQTTVADEGAMDEEPTEEAPADEAPAEAPPADTEGAQDYGTVTLGDEVIALDGGFGCFDEEQEAAGGGGMITLTVRVTGTTAAGDPVVLDLTRYDEDSMFTGDDILLDIGELDFETGEYSVGSYTAQLDLGAAGDPPVLAADGFMWEDFEAGEQLAGAFEITC